MPQKTDQDLFENSTMTFGEHLEELRGVLFRSLIGLVIGFVIGLSVSKYVVRWITTPLKSAMEEHYTELAENELNELYPEGVTNELKEFVANQGLLFEEVYLEQAELERIAGDSANAFADVAADKDVTQLTLPRPSPRMIKTRLAQISHRRPITQRPGTVHDLGQGRILRRHAAGQPLHLLADLVVCSRRTLSSREALCLSVLADQSGAVLDRRSDGLLRGVPVCVEFLFQFNRALDIQTDPRISEWIGFVLILPLGLASPSSCRWSCSS